MGREGGLGIQSHIREESKTRNDLGCHASVDYSRQGDCGGNFGRLTGLVEAKMNRSPAEKSPAPGDSGHMVYRAASSEPARYHHDILISLASQLTTSVAHGR